MRVLVLLSVVACVSGNGRMCGVTVNDTHMADFAPLMRPFHDLYVTQVDDHGSPHTITMNVCGGIVGPVVPKTKPCGLDPIANELFGCGACGVNNGRTVCLFDFTRARLRMLSSGLFALVETDIGESSEIRFVCDETTKAGPVTAVIDPNGYTYTFTLPTFLACPSRFVPTTNSNVRTLFVRQGGGPSVSGCGSRDAPCLSLAAAVMEASAVGTNVHLLSDIEREWVPFGRDLTIYGDGHALVDISLFAVDASVSVRGVTIKDVDQAVTVSLRDHNDNVYVVIDSCSITRANSTLAVLANALVSNLNVTVSACSLKDSGPIAVGTRFGFSGGAVTVEGSTIDGCTNGGGLIVTTFVEPWLTYGAWPTSEPLMIGDGFAVIVRDCEFTECGLAQSLSEDLLAEGGSAFEGRDGAVQVSFAATVDNDEREVVISNYSLTVTWSRFISCRSMIMGAAIYAVIAPANASLGSHTRAAVTVEESTFVHNAAPLVGGAVVIAVVSPAGQRQVSCSGPTIDLGDTPPLIEPSASVVVRRCVFRENWVDPSLLLEEPFANSVQSGGALCIAGLDDVLWLNDGEVSRGFLTVLPRLTVAVEDTVFDGNECASSCYGGAFFALNGEHSFSNVSFHDNSAYNGGAIGLRGTAVLNATGLSFTGANQAGDLGSVIYSRAQGSVTISRSVFNFVGGSAISVIEAGKITFDESTLLTCPQGHSFVISGKRDPSVLALTSSVNPYLSQSIRFDCVPCPTGSYSLDHGWLTRATNSISSPHAITCTPCPLGATCANGSVRAVEGWWLSPTSSHAPVPCPAGYCGGSGDCVNRRTGRLCGECEQGTTASIGGVACVDSASCGARQWFVVVLALLAAVVVVTVLLISPVKSHSGVDTVAVFFFQMASITTTTSSSSSALSAAISDLFNMRASSSITACPFKSLSPRASLALPYTVPAVLFAVLFAARLLCWPTHWGRDRLGVAVARLALFSYSTMVKTTFVLLECVPVGDGVAVLWRAGGETCWAGWQAPVFVLAAVLCATPVVMAVVTTRVHTELLHADDASWVTVLVGAYKTDHRWWGAWLLGQIVILDIVFLAANKTMATRAELTVALALVFLLVHGFSRPFRSSLANTLQAMLLALLVMMAALAVPNAQLRAIGAPAVVMAQTADYGRVQDTLLVLVLVVVAVTWVWSVRHTLVGLYRRYCTKPVESDVVDGEEMTEYQELK